MRTHSQHEAGFTLVEMIVSVALFAVVMLVCVGALLSLVNANRKAQALQSVMNNLNIALDGMVREIRMGSLYYCASNISQLSANYTPQSCQLGGDAFAFEPYNKTIADPPTVYSYNATTKRIYKSVEGASPIPITAPEVTIEEMRFYVVGTDRANDYDQPKVVIMVKGTAGSATAAVRTTFHIQATAVQRLLDL